MKQNFNLDPSIAVTVHIGPVSHRESTPIIFRNDDQDWTSAYEFSIWNSQKKNQTVVDASGMLVHENNVLTITLPPGAIAQGEHYYEIFDRDVKRILFKGTLTIIP